MAILSQIVLACALDPGTRTTFRDTEVPIGATTRFEAEKFSGDWVVRQSFENPQSLAAASFQPSETSQGVWSEQYVNCIEDACVRSVQEFDATALARGIFETRQSAPEPSRQIWVIWVDEGHRTAAIGTPDGQFGWIMDRNATGGADRIKAARDIMAFYGYEIALLKDVTWPE